VEYITGKVTILQPTYLPGLVSLQMDSGNATCPAGTWLEWGNPSTENNLAMHSTLMAAMIAGKRIHFIINDGDTSCRGQFVHLLGT